MVETSHKTVPKYQHFSGNTESVILSPGFNGAEKNPNPLFKKLQLLFPTVCDDFLDAKILPFVLK